MSTAPRRLVSLIPALALLTAVAAAQEGPRPRPAAEDVERITAFGVGVEAADLYRFLDPPPLDARTRATVEKALDELGDPEYDIREEAAARLRRMGREIQPILEEHRENDDPEVSDRILQILESLRSVDFQAVVASALRVVATLEDPAAVGPLLSFLDAPTAPQHVPAALAALIASVDDDSAGPIVARIVDDERPVGQRAQLVEVLGKARVEGARETLQDLLGSSRPQLALESAVALLSWGDRSAAGGLIELLSSDDQGIRYRAEYALRRVLGPTFDFNAYAAAEERARSAEAWRTWWAEEGAAGRELPAPSPEEEGITTICDHSGNRLIEVDKEGKILWKHEGIRGPCRVEWLPNGNLLVGGGYSNRLFELDRDGEEVWAAELQTMYVDADRLPDGNTLVTSYTEKFVAVLDRKGAKVWEWTSPEVVNLTDADRLPNGNTLICDYAANRLFEVDAAGDVVWEIKTLSGPYEADRLPNGNTIVAESSGGRVTEIDREGNVVWKYEGLQGSHHVDRLPSGNTLICDSDGDRVLEVTPEKEIVWEFTDCSHPDDADRR